MIFLDLARRRFSARGYLDRDVPGHLLQHVLEAGRVAPSAVNYQPWFFVVVKNHRTDPKWREVYKRQWFFEAPALIVLCCDRSRSWKRADGKDHGDIDIAIAADHMTLAATDAGLATCWICNFDPQKLAQVIGASQNIEPAVILTLGYPASSPDTERHTAQRKEADHIIIHEKFSK